MLYSFSIQFLIFVVMLPLGGLVFSLSIFNLCGFDFGITFVLDIVSVMFFSCVCMVSSAVFFYSIFYISGDLTSRRFSLLVGLFVFSIGLLVFSGNLVLLIIG